jgi:hypothetical protein
MGKQGSLHPTPTSDVEAATLTIVHDDPFRLLPRYYFLLGHGLFAAITSPFLNIFNHFLISLGTSSSPYSVTISISDSKNRKPGTYKIKYYHVIDYRGSLD